MPNPSNSDLVGEALRRIEEADISPDDVFDFADAVSKLAQQLEQAEQREKRRKVFGDVCVNDRDYFRAEAERYREALERILAYWNPNHPGLHDVLDSIAEIARAALTTPDSEESGG